MVKRAIAAGKDVYAEWPLATSTVTAGELLSLAEEKGVRHIVAMQRRFSPEISAEFVGGKVALTSGRRIG